MFQRVPQPPVNRTLRPTERHGFWPGFVLALTGVLLGFAGAQRLTGVNTVEGESARETELIKAFTSSGLQYASLLEPPAPPKPTGDPAADAAALAKWDRDQTSFEPLAWKIRVDTSAKDPCPT
jgi:hypothetical protein